MYNTLRRRYANDPRWLSSLGADVLAGLLLAIAFPYLLWQSIHGIRLKHCDQGKHRYRVIRVDRTLRPVEWRCRTCDQYKWFSQGEERHSVPPWYPK